jgi:hypothetical protein
VYRFLTSPGHGYTVEILVRRQMGVEIPRCERLTYRAMLASTVTRQAIHVFTDLERLSDVELAAAAALYRNLREAGIPCLNDPARVMTRYQLLRHLFEAGINPFAVYRADGVPRPARFPVFVRAENDHDGAMSELLPDQASLDALLEEKRAGGRPLRGLLVIGYAAQEEAPGLYRKAGTYTVCGRHSKSHVMFGSNWVVKRFGLDVATEDLERRELAEVRANLVPDAVAEAFRIAGIEWGRADHATVDGREVIYEINTNPMVYVPTRGNLAIRPETKRVALERMAGFLRESDRGDGRPVCYRTPMPLRNRLGSLALRFRQRFLQP